MLLVRLCIFYILLAGLAYAAVLVNSGNSMKAGNPQRNYQVNKKFLCPDIAPGRTQVWSIDWQAQLPNSFSYYNGFETTQDGDGFLHIGGYYKGGPVLFKVNSTDGSYSLDDMIVMPGNAFSEPTHVQGNIMYLVGETQSIIVNTTSMKQIAAVDLGFTTTYGCYAPIGNDLMVSARTSPDSGSLVFYINTASYEYDTNQPNSDGENPTHVIVYKNSSNVEIPITISGNFQQPVQVWSPNYQFAIEDSIFHTAAYVQDDRLIVHYGTANFNYHVAFYNPNTGALLNNVSLSWQGEAIQGTTSSRVFGSKSVASVSGNFGNKVVDFLNSKLLLDDAIVRYEPLYSIPDNSVLLSYQSPNIEFAVQQWVSLDWDTQMINAVGSFPSDGQYGDFLMTPPLVSDDCTVYTYFDDTLNYRGVLFAHKPLPISSVVPIAECVNANGVGYLSYNNLEDKRILIPYASDRNNIEPMNVAGASDFLAKKRGKYFPLSCRVTLSNDTTSFTWKLEDYVLSFANTVQFRCPQNVTLVLTFSSSSAVSDTFAEWVRSNVASFSGISDSRVTVMATKKRSALATTQITLLVAADPSGQEKTPEEAAQYLYNQQLSLFKSALSGSQYAAMSLEDIDGMPLATEISGTIPPKSQPVSQPPSSNNVPTATPNNVPKSSTSFAVPTVTCTSTVIMIALLLGLM